MQFSGLQTSKKMRLSQNVAFPRLQSYTTGTRQNEIYSPLGIETSSLARRLEKAVRKMRFTARLGLKLFDAFYLVVVCSRKMRFTARLGLKLLYHH